MKSHDHILQFLYEIMPSIELEGLFTSCFCASCFMSDSVMCVKTNAVFHFLLNVII